MLSIELLLRLSSLMISLITSCGCSSTSKCCWALELSIVVVPKQQWESVHTHTHTRARIYIRKILSGKIKNKKMSYTLINLVLRQSVVNAMRINDSVRNEFHNR